MSAHPASIDRSRTRVLFNRRRADAAFIEREVSGRMMERLEAIRLAPSWVLDAGCGRGADRTGLEARFEAATIVGLDAAYQPLTQQPGSPAGLLKRWFGRRRAPLVAADLASLPIAPNTLDCIWSNLALHWLDDAHQVFPEWHRVLRAGGLVLFSAFGPDTLREVRAAFRDVDELDHTMAFTDMHDYGDMLVNAGFSTPVMDMETLTLTYSSPISLWADVRALGGNALTQRRRTLMGRRAAARLGAQLDATRAPDGRYRLTFEIVYGHAWRAEPKVRADGASVVRFDRAKPASPSERP